MYKYAKPFLDRVLALIGLVILAPLFGWVAWRIHKEDGGPVFFEHTRIGRGRKPFQCLKFRTMRNDAQATLARWKAENTPEWQEFSVNFKLVHDPRVLGIGRLLRKTSLDELPQLLNVLRGEMSLVGPRPVTAEELAHYESNSGLDAYLATSPGITGLWQVSGRSNTTYPHRVALDKAYAGRITAMQDLHILWRTLRVPFSQDGAY